MKLIIASTVAFRLALVLNQIETMVLASTGAHPEIPHWLDQRYLFLAAWRFPVLAVWGFNARWLPVFLGIGEPSIRGLMAALAASTGGLAAALFGHLQIATLLLLIASILASVALSVSGRSRKPAKTRGVSSLGFRVSFVALTSGFFLRPALVCTRRKPMLTAASGALPATL